MIDNKEVITFIALIKNIIERPGMYLVNKVEDIELIFFGYELAKKNTELTAFINEFRVFVNKWADYKNDNNWAKLIRFYSSTDVHSINLFANLFKDYVNTLSIV